MTTNLPRELIPFLTAHDRAELNKLLRTVQKQQDFTQFLRKPVEYSRHVLKVQWWAKQQEIARLLLEPPYRVLVLSAHSVGKSFLGASLTNWWYDTRDPGLVITTAPTHRDVVDILWSEVRLQRMRAGMGGFIGSRAPELRSSEDHYAKGFTAAKGESFQGRHPARALWLMDEAVGIDSVFWDTTSTMFVGNGEHAWVCFFNPTDTASRAYQEYLRANINGEKRWHVVTMAARDHPNIAAELAGEPPLYPGAVRLSQLNDWVRSWTTRIHPGDVIPGFDFEWPPGRGEYFRPGPLFESRASGMWPSQSTYSVWSNWLWNVCEKSRGPVSLGGEIPHTTIPEIGCDPARFGNDFTSMIAQDAGTAIHHETHNGWSGEQIVGRLKQLCAEMVAHCIKKNPDFHGLRPQQIPVKIDADGMGGLGVVDHAAGYNFIGISGSAMQDGDYRNMRSQLWFNAVELAKGGYVHLGRLPVDALDLLRQQVVSPMYKINNRGQLEVEPKENTKDRLGRSPDDADALNLAYYRAPTWEAPPVVDEPPRPRIEAGGRESRQKQRGLFR